uniref:HAT C-terminal dimerisation domain-containing protein n=1 Tax=Phlebotomus papatasi TaxID=29031 RepID=A0A1B0F089_PHLPP
MFQIMKSHLDDEFARAVYATASPFMLSENQYFKKFIQTLRPEYTPPSRKQLSGTLLVKEYQRIEQNINEIITKASVLSIMCDGIINIIIMTPKPVFITSIDTTTNPHSGEYLAKILLATMEKYGTEKFQALVTDNAAANKKAWAILEEKVPNLQCYGCFAHSLNLILGDVLECARIKKIIQDGKAIVNGINLKQVLKAELNKRSSVTLKLPVKTRWLSMEQFLSSLLANKITLREMAIQDKLNQALQSIVLGSDFWDKITELKSIICIVTTRILQFEGDRGDISECYPSFREMLRELEMMGELSFLDGEKNYMMEVIEKRKKVAIKAIHKASYLLNPKYLGKTLSASDRLEAINFMASLSTSCSEEEILNDISNYATKSGEYNVPIVWKYIETNKQSPLQWWMAFYPEAPLCQIAQRILQVPPTSCVCERSFSQQKNVHTVKRNRLGSDTVDKLISPRRKYKVRRVPHKPHNHKPHNHKPHNHKPHNQKPHKRRTNQIHWNLILKQYLMW